MSATLTTVAAALKQHYQPGTINDLSAPEGYLFAAVPKDKSLGGEDNGWIVPVIIGHNQGQSATFAKAQANATNVNVQRFAVGTVQHYGVGNIDGKLIRASKGDSNAFMKFAAAEIDSTFKGAARRYDLDIFRNGWGSVGRVANANLATTVCTLVTANDVYNFEVGMKLVASDTEGASVLRSAGATLTVASIDEEAGTVTMTANLSAGIAAIAQNDYLFVEGDRQNLAQPARLRMTGLAAYVPPAATSIGTLWGLDCTQNKTRLGGHRIDGTKYPIEECYTKLASKIANAGGKPDVIVCSFDRWEELESALGSRRVYSDMTVDGVDYGFTGLVINGPKGKIRVVGDTGCPNSAAWMLQLNTWTFGSMGEPIGFLEEDDLPMLRSSTADSYEVRCGGYFNLACKAPGWNGVVAW